MSDLNTVSGHSFNLSKKKFIVFILGFIAVFGGFSLLKGGLYSDVYEVDVTHLIDIILRMSEGQTPHVDFSTPLGILSFLPIYMFTLFGFGIGMSYLLSQVLIALIFAPLIYRVASSRLYGVSAWLFAISVLTFVLSLVYGGEKLSQSVSMFYNRWAWGAAFIILLLALLPEHEGQKKPIFDGVVIGLLLAALAFSKPTYVLGLSLPVVIALLNRRAFLSLGSAVLAGLGVAVLMYAAYGSAFYLAYIHDLLSVVQSPTRSSPGLSFPQLLNTPQYLIGTLALVLSVIVLRQMGSARAGVLLLVTAPGLIYVTYQNFGNDPKWLLFLCIYLLAYRPKHDLRVIFNARARSATMALALVAFCLYAPSFQNMIFSPLRHYQQQPEDYVLHITQPKYVSQLTGDLWQDKLRAETLVTNTSIIESIPALADYGQETQEPTEFLGTLLPYCTIFAGDAVLQRYMADRLHQAPFEFGPETQFFIADVTSTVWMQGGFQPLLGGAPWYYSGAPGLEHADALVIPRCPMGIDSMKEILTAVEATGTVFGEPISDEVMVVYPVLKAAKP